VTLPLIDATTEYAATCARLGHPGATYNPLLDRTWCACGVVVRPGGGDRFYHVTCCGGPLDRRTS